jgi:hypothetical protein
MRIGGTMFSGKTNTLAKLWREKGSIQFGSLKSETPVKGRAPESDGFVYLTSPVAGWTKKIWLKNYQEDVVTPPPPPPPPSDPITIDSVTINYTENGVKKSETITNG